ncbi:hypothetical protein [Dyella sp. C9]|uniref:hypothetical protein n=1 Tax=Dyella sp. C9 TaxID=2202154 RepID=UPI000DEF9BE0|nr:hypothetical protein [Dyella sp. C9]
MFLKVRREGTRAGGFALWRLVVWLMLLLAAYGCVQYGAHAEQLWQALQQQAPGNTEAISQLHGMLAWDAGYFVVAFAVLVICAGAILGQAWSRRTLQVIAVLLAVVWGLLGALQQFSQWRDFSRTVEMTVQGPMDAAAQIALNHVRLSYLIAVAIRAVGVPVLLWLAWQLGRPQVRSFFHGRR